MVWLPLFLWRHLGPDQDPWSSMLFRTLHGSHCSRTRIVSVNTPAPSCCRAHDGSQQLGVQPKLNAEVHSLRGANHGDGQQQVVADLDSTTDECKSAGSSSIDSSGDWGINKLATLSQ